MIAHRGPISGIATFRDRLVATAGYDNQVILWDQASHASLGRVQHDHLANHCAFSPDGTLLVTSSSDYTARIWSVPGLALVAVLNDQDDDVEMAVFDPRGEAVATASRDHGVRVHGLDGVLRHHFRGHTADVISVDWVAGGDELITSSDDGTVKRWSLSRGGLVEDIDLGGVETDTVVVDPSGRIYAGNDLGEIVVVGPEGPARVRAHDAGIKRLVLSPERGLLISMSYDRALRLWDVRGARPEPVAQTEFPADVWPRSCAFAAGDTVVCGTFGQTYRTFDYVRGAWRDETVPVTGGANAAVEHDGSVLSIGDSGWLHRDGHPVVDTGSLCNFLTPVPQAGVVLTGGQLGVVMDALTGRVLHRHHSPVNCAAVLSAGDEGARVVVGAYTGEGIVLRLGADGAVEHLCDIKLHENAVKGVAVGAGVLFSVCADRSAAWHDATSLAEVARREGAHDRIANACAGLGRDGFGSVGRDRVLRLWSPELDGGPTCDAVAVPLSHSVKCLAVSDDATALAVGSYDGHVAVLDLVTRQWSCPPRPSASGISSMAWSPTFGCFLASAYDGVVHRIDVAGAAPAAPSPC